MQSRLLYEDAMRASLVASLARPFMRTLRSGPAGGPRSFEGVGSHSRPDIVAAPPLAPGRVASALSVPDVKARTRAWRGGVRSDRR